MKLKLFLLFGLLCTITWAQNTITGTIKDVDGTSLPGVNIVQKSTLKGTTSDFDGKYSIEVNADAVLVFSYIGFEQQEISVNGKSEIDVTMASGLQLSEVQIVGSRNPERTSTDTAVPVDIINVAEVSTQSGQLEVNQLLQYAAPSFTPTSNLVLMVQIMLILHRCGVWDQIKPWF